MPWLETGPMLQRIEFVAEYPGHFIVKRVTNAGTFRLKHKLLFLAHPLCRLPIGLDETDDGIWSIYFSNVLIGRVDEREMRIHG